MFAVRPPEYFPRPAWFALMASVDTFVVADTFQYSRQSYQNRARLRTPDGVHWISIPLRGGQHGRPIAAVEIDPRRDWPGKHRRAFEYNYRSTPFFEYYEPDFVPLFRREWTHLAALTGATIRLLHRLLGLTTELVFASALPGVPATPAAVREALGGPGLLSPEDAAPYDRRSVPDVAVFRYRTPAYRQNFPGFEPDVSVVDLLFNYGPEATGILLSGIS